MNFVFEPIKTEASVLLTDSRLVTQAEQSIFFAIKGEHHDGHLFVLDLYEKGVREFVVEKKASPPELIKKWETCVGAKFFLVENAVKALQELVIRHRRQFDLPVVGITGSNGKTIVKEWLSALLANDYHLVKSPGSYNSQIGVPLSVWQLNATHSLGIFEAGISITGEMERLEPMIRPSIGIFTNIGPAHNVGFRSLKSKITEKLRLFQHSQVLIYCKDYETIDEEITILLKAVNPNLNLIAWSKNSEQNFGVSYLKEKKQTLTKINWNDTEFEFQIPFTDDASIENVTHCLMVMLYLGKTQTSIQAGLNLLKPIAMRLELKQGINDCYLIDDTYNNDYAGLSVALNFMSQQHTKRRKVLIVSDLLQSGVPDSDLYESISDLCANNEIDFVIGIGERISAHKNHFKNAVFFPTTDTFLSEFHWNELKSSLILVKGARMFGFEKIVNKLVSKVHGTVFEINLEALTHNLNFYRNKIGQSTKIMVMVKAFAYGSGSAEIASLLEYHRVDYLGVAYTDEGVFLRENGIKLPIMVLNPQPESFIKLVEMNLEPEIYSFKILDQFLSFIENKSGTFKVHLKVDTGMHRLGFEKKDIAELLLKLKQHRNLEIASIFSHLVGADESVHNEFSKKQIDTFLLMTQEIESQLGISTLKHICNSAGIIRFPEARFDMVRLGIGLYGVEASGGEQAALQTVGTLKTIISQIKFVAKGETIGYSRKGILEKDSKIATIAIGYADGFDRGFSNGVGEVLVNGVLCPVIGNVCMDMTMIDVSEADCEEGDVAIVFGKEPSIQYLASKIGTIPYEILTNVSERVKRVFYKE